jgi:hypothetical protein
MSRPPIQSPSLKIHCGNLAVEEVGALRRLLNLLASHLRYPWELVEDLTTAHLVILNVDQPGTLDASTAARVIGCASKPAAHPDAKYHRPLRAYELLAALSEIKPTDTAQAQTDKHADAWRYKLRSWPLDLAAYGRDQLTVMAAITREYRCASELAIRTGVAVEVVNECLRELSRLGLLEGEPEQRRLPRVDPHELGRWQSLASRVGQLLGFRR